MPSGGSTNSGRSNINDAPSFGQPQHGSAPPGSSRPLLPPSDKSFRAKTSAPPITGGTSRSGTSRSGTSRSSGSDNSEAASNLDVAKELEDAFDEEEEDDGAPKPDRTYRYKASGRNQRVGSTLKGKKVDWEATIEVPLEELIYPSLQHFNVTTKDVYGATGMRKEQHVVMKDSAVAGNFASTTLKWVANIDDAPHEELHLEAAGKERDRYSVPDILRRGEIHLRRRLKDSAAVDLMAYAKGWPQLAGKPTLTETERITASVVRVCLVAPWHASCPA